MTNFYSQTQDPCYTSYEMEVGLLVGSKSALLENLNRWFPGRGDKAKLARKLGKTAGTVTRWFNGTRDLSLDDLDRIAATIGKRPQDLITDYSDPKSTGVTPRQALEILNRIVPEDA